MSAALRLIDVPEPELLFGHGQRMAHPKDGLLLYGPSEALPPGTRLRIGVVSTQEGLRRYSQCVNRLAKPIEPKKENDPNHTPFPGFEAAFGARWAPKPDVWLQVDKEQLAQAIRIEDRHQAIHKAVSL